MKQFKDFIEEESNQEVASTYKRIAVQHLKDMMAKDASNSSKIYAKKMHQRALEASKMSNHTDALNHYRGMKEEIEIEEASPMIKPPNNEFAKKEDAFAHAKKHGGKVVKRTFTHPTSGMKTSSYIVKKDLSYYLYHANEEVEQIDELKRKTLASYISKAAGNYGRDKQLIGRTSPDGTMKNADADLKRAVKNRLTGINRAAERLAKEEAEKRVAEEIELFESLKTHYQNGYDAHQKGKTRQDNPHREGTPAASMWAKGWEHSFDKKEPQKFANEEVEHIDELSSELMRRAADKYQDKIDRAKHSSEIDKLGNKKAHMSGQASATERGKRYSDKGLAGPGARQRKMNANEEVEQIDEISQATKDSYAKKAKDEVSQLKSHVKGEYGGIVKRMIARRKKGIKLAQKKTSE